MGLNITPKHIVLDLYQNKYIMIQASQYDIDARKLIIHVTNDGEFFKIPQKNYGASIEYKKPDNTIGVVDCEILEDGTLSFTITDQMVAVPGYCKCDLLLASNKEAVNTNAFIINVRESAVQGDEYESKDDFTSLTKTVTRARSAITKMSQMQEEFSGYIDESTKTIDHCLDQAERAQAIADQVDSAVLTAIEKAGETAINAKAASSSATSAQSSATKAKTSEDNAKTSETNAKASETLVGTYSTNAKTSETNAKTSETNAQSYASSAQSSKTSAQTSANTATTKANEAKSSASSASASATLAEQKANEIVDIADKSKSYAVGTDDEYRENDSVDNARYYYEQAKSISEGLQGALLPMGTVTFSELATQSKVAGYMYNISDEFTTDDTFKEGSGHTYPLGTNVYYTADGYWDCLAGTPVTGIKGNSEKTYRKGNVNITPANIGLGNVPNVATNDQTPTYTEASSNAKLTSGEKLSIAFGKISKAISSLISHLSNKSNPHEVTKAQVGLGNCDNTSDANKPISNATQEALDKKANTTDLTYRYQKEVLLSELLTSDANAMNIYLDGSTTASFSDVKASDFLPEDKNFIVKDVYVYSYNHKTYREISSWHGKVCIFRSTAGSTFGEGIFFATGTGDHMDFTKVYSYATTGGGEYITEASREYLGSYTKLIINIKFGVVMTSDIRDRHTIGIIIE